ncbi:hypothetical protein QJS10_CPB15g00478 [Acorus calamus]|uniref:Uncharacterized protein n=1 Tax=Acorus calamus TaxID=4465 RepID=A0AAV9D8X9_ACOCL|nr:hypothetical protein QJS10_CPB15g00478 [Acorus calamus]
MGCAFSKGTMGMKRSVTIYGSGVFAEAGRSPEKFNSGGLETPVSGQPAAKKAAGAGKVPEKSSLLGRVGIVGLEKAVEVLDTLGSSVSNMNVSSGFASGMAVRGNKIAILAFEVANTIHKGAGLLQSLSEENIQFLKEDILKSDGVQRLVSSDMEVLLRIAASDKREEVDLFSGEVARFGDLCKDPTWHNLGRYFQKLDSDLSNKQKSDEVDATMQQLHVLAQNTSELYHELHALDGFEQDYQRKVQEGGSSHAQRGESLMILHSELKHQRKFVRSLKKKSLWSRNLEEVVEKLVDVVTFLYQRIFEAFGSSGKSKTKSVDQSQIHDAHKLGVSGLALHYANIINQIDNIVSRPSSVPPNARDALYRGLPAGVKAALRSRVQSLQDKEFTVPHIKAEIEKTLHWVVPMAENTTRAHQDFGWVGEWANSSIELNKEQFQNSVLRIETLYHADKEKMDEHILELVTWLHLLVSQVRNKGHYHKFNAPIRSPTHKESLLSQDTELEPSKKTNIDTNMGLPLSQEDREMLEEVTSRKLAPGRSKSQEFACKKKRTKRELGLSRSSGNSPTKEFSAALDLQRRRTMSVLDVMDGLDRVSSLRST